MKVNETQKTSNLNLSMIEHIIIDKVDFASFVIEKIYFLYMITFIVERISNVSFTTKISEEYITWNSSFSSIYGEIYIMYV